MVSHKELKDNPHNDIEHSGPLRQPIIKDPIPHEILILSL